jgi:mRNA interferase RelE/StbE
MIFEIRWDKKALAFLRRLDRHISDRIVRKVDGLKSDPKRYLEVLGEIHGYKLRVGDYRIIIDVDWDSKIISVLLIGHRKKIYEKI